MMRRRSGYGLKDGGWLTGSNCVGAGLGGERVDIGGWVGRAWGL